MKNIVVFDDAGGVFFRMNNFWDSNIGSNKLSVVWLIHEFCFGGFLKNFQFFKNLKIFFSQFSCYSIWIFGFFAERNFFSFFLVDWMFIGIINEFFGSWSEEFLTFFWSECATFFVCNLISNDNMIENEEEIRILPLNTRYLMMMMIC